MWHKTLLCPLFSKSQNTKCKSKQDLTELIINTQSEQDVWKQLHKILYLYEESRGSHLQVKLFCAFLYFLILYIKSVLSTDGYTAFLQGYHGTLHDLISRSTEGKSKEQSSHNTHDMWRLRRQTTGLEAEEAIKRLSVSCVGIRFSIVDTETFLSSWKRSFSRSTQTQFWKCFYDGSRIWTRM